MDLSQQIKELFPTEEKEIYFIPRCQSKDSKEVISSRGCLYNSYKHVRKQLRKAGKLTKNIITVESNKGEIIKYCLFIFKLFSFNQFEISNML